MSGIKECDNCKVIINSDIEYEFFYICRNEHDYCFCECCGQEKLVYSDNVEGYVLKEDYKECYLDDEIADLCIFDKVSRYFLCDIEMEPDWDAIADDIKLGLL